MKECGKNYRSLLKKYSLKTGYATNLISLDTVSITVKYLYSLENKRPCGIKLINVWGNVSMSNIAAFYVDIWYSREPNDLPLNTRKIDIRYFKPNSISVSMYPVSIKHHNTKSDLIITLVNINFMGRSAFYMQCDHCSGYSMLYVQNCNFSGRSYKYTNPTVKLDYKAIKRNHTIPHKVVFKNCNFTNNEILGMLLDIDYHGDTIYTNITTQLMVSLSRCVFRSNKCTNVCQINYGKYLNRCTKDDAVLLFLTDLVFTDHHVFSVVHGKCVSAYFEGIIISNCVAHLSVITVLSSKMTFHKYNEVSSTSAVTVITAGKIVLKETVLLNFTLNNLTNALLAIFCMKLSIMNNQEDLLLRLLKNVLFSTPACKEILTLNFSLE